MSVGDEPFTIEFAREAEREIREMPPADARMILQKKFKVSSRLSRLKLAKPESNGSWVLPRRCIGCEAETTGLTTVLVRSKLWS